MLLRENMVEQANRQAVFLETGPLCASAPALNFMGAMSHFIKRHLAMTASTVWSDVDAPEPSSIQLL